MFIGREIELTRLASIRSSLSDHRGAVVRLHGELGIGKTSLIQAYTQSAQQDNDVIYCRCLDSVFSAELTPLFEFTRAHSKDLVTLLDNKADLTTLFSSLLEFFMSRRTTTIIIIEDVQWASSTTLNLLDYFARRLVFSRCMLIISYRTCEIPAKHRLHKALEHIPHNLVHDIALSPLSREVLNLLAFGQHDTDKLYETSGGNPLFVRQLNLLGGRPATTNIAIEDAIRTQIDSLNDKERTLLEMLSVIPYPIMAALMEKLSGDGSILTPLTDTSSGFLCTDINDCFIFQHELLRQTVKEQVSEIRQVKFHTEILNAYDELNEDPNHSWRLLHAHGASLGEEVIRLSIQLAKKSSTINDHSEAIAYLSIALNYAYIADDKTAATLYETWAKEARFSEDLSEKIFDYTQHAISLWKSIGRDDKVGENLYLLSRFHWFNGNPAQAQILADQAIQVLEKATDIKQVAKAYSLRSQLCLLQNEHSNSIAFGKKALEFERRAKDYEVKTHALNNIGTSMMLTGDSTGSEQLQKSLDLAIKHQLHEHISRGYVNFACCSFHTKDLATAKRLVSEGITYGTTHENHSKSSYLSGIMAQILTEQGKLVNAESIASGLLSSNEKTLIVLMPAQNTLARVYSLMAHPEAEQKLQQALSKSLAIGEPQYTITARFNLVEYAWINERTELAEEQIRKLTEIGSSKLDSWRLAELWCWASRFGFEAEIPKAHYSIRPYQLELAGEYIAASNAWAELGIPLNQAICLLLNNTQPSSNYLMKAYNISKSCSATGLTNKISREAQRLGLDNITPKRHRGHSKDTKQHPLGLTKKEQEILKQILIGRSNSEISNELSRSTRTIENHVSSILRKFNVKNRLEVILRTQNEPWLNLPKA